MMGLCKIYRDVGQGMDELGQAAVVAWPSSQKLGGARGLGAACLPGLIGEEAYLALRLQVGGLQWRLKK